MTCCLSIFLTFSVSISGKVVNLASDESSSYLELAANLARLPPPRSHSISLPTAPSRKPNSPPLPKERLLSTILDNQTLPPPQASSSLALKTGEPGSS